VGKNIIFKVGEILKKIGKFFAGVKKEIKRVRWPKKDELVKFSLATLACILIIALFFVLSDLLLAGIRILLEKL